MLTPLVIDHDGPLIDHDGPLGLLGLVGWLMWVVWIVVYGIVLMRPVPAPRRPTGR
ncbi:hypothetical protein ABZ568_35795 [Streptomyces olindensis]|uniref:Uncharacterized protein n=1 Tax=Streptomyces olindensis TaxID=358823 RepID=A0ABV2Y601_9ACTN